MKKNVQEYYRNEGVLKERVNLKRGPFPKAEIQTSLEKVWLQPTRWW